MGCSWGVGAVRTFLHRLHSRLLACLSLVLALEGAVRKQPDLRVGCSQTFESHEYHAKHLKGAEEVWGTLERLELVSMCRKHIKRLSELCGGGKQPVSGLGGEQRGGPSSSPFQPFSL